jgi:hypothetical protein
MPTAFAEIKRTLGLEGIRDHAADETGAPIGTPGGSLRSEESPCRTGRPIRGGILLLAMPPSTWILVRQRVDMTEKEAAPERGQFDREEVNTMGDDAVHRTSTLHCNG